MTLKYELESVDGLDDSTKSLYVEDNGKFRLKIEGLDIPDVSGLKNSRDTILTEKKQLEAKAAELESQLKSMKLKNATGDDDFKAMLQDSEKQREELQAKLQEMQDSFKRTQHKAEADRVAATLTKDTAKAKLLSDVIGSRLRVTDEGIKVTDLDGNLTVSKVDDILPSIKNEYPFLCDGKGSSGGGAPGGEGGAGETKTINRNDFTALPPAKQMEFTRAGGVVTD